MPRILILLLLLLVSPIGTLSAAPPAEPVGAMSISTGAEGGGYWGIGSRLATAVKKYGGRIEVRSSAGSLENLQRLRAPVDPTVLALTQADALAYFLRSQPEFSEEFQQIESIGRECVFLITATDHGVDAFADLEQDGQRLAIPGKSSGVAVTFMAMQSMHPPLRATEAVYMSSEQAMRELAKPAGQRQIDALMLVHRPKVRSKALKQAIYEPGTYRLVAIDNNRLDGKLPNGKPVYSSLKLPLRRDNWSSRETLETICMEGLLLSAPQKLTPEQSAILKRTIDYDWMQVYAEPLR